MTSGKLDNDEDSSTSSVVSKLSSLVGLYAVFVYVSGWTYLDFYYRAFGFNTRWVDISIPETLMKGFIILFEGGQGLWFIYVFVVVIPVLFEVFPRLRRHLAAQLAVALAMLACLPATYYVAKSVGEDAARRNKGEFSTLPEITFSTDCRNYVGKLLFVKDGYYYIHDAEFQSMVHQSDPKCAAPSGENRKSDIHELEIFRAESVHDLTITEY